MSRIRDCAFAVALVGLAGMHCVASGQDSPRETPALSVDAGYVFIDREFVPPPYLLREVDGRLLINDRPVARHADRRRPMPGGNWREGRPPPETFGTQREEPRRPPSGPGWGRSGMGGPWEDRGTRWLAQQLQDERVVLGSADKPVQVLDDITSMYLLKSLKTQATDQTALQGVLSSLPPQEDNAEWTAWLTTYRLPASLEPRANALIQKYEQAAAMNEASAAAVKRLNALAYPLNVLGMVLSVLALGHLLRSLPKSVDESIPGQRLHELRRAAAVSIGLVVILSGLDLTWTLLASQAGQMTELNPIGSQLIDDPRSLTIFKVTATLASCGLLLALRSHARAQIASWWLCLVCTVLTFRWLVLNSMFVT